MASTQFERYGEYWSAQTDALSIEFFAIRKGGTWLNAQQKPCGLGLFHHYKQAMTLLWPEDDWHRWAVLFLDRILANKILGVMGPQNSNKTYMAAKYALTDYFAFPENTGILVSSTDLRGLELRVWGTVKQLFNRAIARYDLPGVVLESMHTITTDDLEEDEGRARVLKKGIICIPCLASGRYVGLGKYIGFKQNRVRLIADECQLMGQSFLDAVSNLGGNLDFKGIFLGNPLDPLDPLGLACEPENGWTSHPEPTKTTVWKTRFKNGECLNFVGTDSPNFDFDQSKAPTYAYLIHKARIEEVEAFWGKDSQQYFSQVIGVMKSGLLSRRIITADLCREHHALEKAVWKDEKRTKIYAVDVAYGGVGGDRCVGGWGEFGEDINGIQILRLNPPVIIPVSIKLSKSPEDQIAEFVWREMNSVGIPAKNGFYDSTGRGTMGSAFARKFGAETPVPVEFGGRPSKRPVRHDLFVYEGRERRLKRCDEHYVDFVSELWFSDRYVIECDQMRELPDAVMREGCQREYGTAAGNKLFVESKHDPKARERMGRSPDMMDWCVTLTEGARQRGFIIQKLGLMHTEDDDRLSWLDERRRKTEALLSSKSLAFK